MVKTKKMKEADDLLDEFSSLTKEFEENEIRINNLSTIIKELTRLVDEGVLVVK